MARTRIHGQQVTDGSIELVDLSSALASTIEGKADAGNLAPVATSGSYNDLSDLPTLFSGAYADLTGKPTLFSGDYADLSNKPSLFDGNYSSLSGAPVLSTVATSGSYNDLSNLPTLFSGSYNDLTDKPSIPSIVGLATETYVDTKVADLVASAPAVLDTLNELAAALGDDPNFATTVAGQIGDVAGDVAALDIRVTAAEGDIASLQTDVAAKADSASLATIATSGSYNDLINLPSLFDGNYSSLVGAPSLATVATSGSYNDLSNLPTLFSGAYADLTGKPTLFSGSYNDLTDKPTFSSDLDGLTDVAITSPSADQVLKYNGTSWVNATAPATFSGSYTDLTDKPTIPSALDDLSDVAVTSAAKGQFIVHNGTSFVNSNTIEASGAAVKPLIVKGIASQTANLFEVQNSGGTVISSVGANGASFHTTTAAAEIPLTVTRPASPTKYGFVVRDSSGNRLFAVGRGGDAAHNWDGNVSSGMIEIGSSLYGMTTLAYNSTSQCLTILSSSSTNQLQVVSENGGFGMTMFSLVRAPSFTANVSKYNLNAGGIALNLNASPGVGINLADSDGVAGSLHVKSTAAARKGIVVQAHASQTENLFEAQNSSGTALFSIDKDGIMGAGAVPVARVTGLHAVATSGSYNDLADKPSIPSIAGLATETYVDNAVAAIVNSAPAVLDTLNELAAALGDDPNFATTMTTALASKADTSSLAAVATSGSYVDLSNKPTIYTPVKEVFTSLVDGTETEFVLSDAPAVAGTEQVFVNGILQSSGASDDYTISGDTITFNTAPEAGWKLIVYYFV